MSKAKAKVTPGICGFSTRVQVESDDSYQVTVSLESNCEKVQAYGNALSDLGPLSVFDELRKGNDGLILGTPQQYLKGCCAACVTPAGVFKAMQVASGLALPAPVAIDLELVGEES